MQVGCKFYIKTNNTNWLNTLLQQEFFSSCYHHQEFGKNEKNLFCIDCNVEICKHCITAHCVHRRLQIFKYVYHDVVRLQEMQKHLDCSKIQVILYSLCSIMELFFFILFFPQFDGTRAFLNFFLIEFDTNSTLVISKIVFIWLFAFMDFGFISQ